MNERMSILGIGPKMAVFTIPYFIITIFLSSWYPHLFNMYFIPRVITLTFGIALLVIGLAFYILTVRTFLAEFKTGNLITKGTFSLCRNPIYATFMLFIIPAVSLLINSWLSLTSSVLIYIVFKILIRREYDYLRGRFGEEYDKYEKRVNEVFPSFWVKS